MRSQIQNTRYKILISWLVPVLISLGIFTLIRPALAQLGEREQDLFDYLASNDLYVNSEVGDNGYSQVYYIWNDEKVFVTDNAYPSESPDSGKKYITWMSQIGGVWQIYLYDVISQTTLQVTSMGNNANPKVSDEGKVVWEGWVPSAGSGQVEGWQVFFFDGVRVVQLTRGDLSVNPDIEGDFITYARRDITGTWRSVVYSIKMGEEKEIATGISSKHPKVKNGKILLADGKEEFPLTIEDLFVLDLTPLTTAEEVTSEEIAKELQPESEAAVSNEVETATTTITPALSPAPEVPAATSESDLSDRPATPTPPAI